MKNKNRITDRSSLVVKKHLRKRYRPIVLALKILVKMAYYVATIQVLNDIISQYLPKTKTNWQGIKYIEDFRLGENPKFIVNEQKLLTYNPKS